MTGSARVEAGQMIPFMLSTIAVVSLYIKAVIAPYSFALFVSVLPARHLLPHLFTSRRHVISNIGELSSDFFSYEQLLSSHFSLTPTLANLNPCYISR